MKRYLLITSVVALVGCAVAGVYVAERFIRISSEFEQLRIRLAHLEAAVQKRETVDPLVPSECAAPNWQGDTKNKPCQTTLYRLLQAPQSFQGRWIVVEGEYVNGFEQSALYPPEDGPFGAPRHFERHTAIWIWPNFTVDKNSVSRKFIIGRFKRGPSGHMGAYFGELTDADLR